MTPTMRVGLGFDVHRMVDGRRLILAGVEVPHPRGPLAHSDGDVIIHALADALLGAAGLGDLGQFFPDTDPAWKDAPGRTILRRVAEMLSRQRWTVLNVDVNVLLEQPKLANLKDAMKQRLAEFLGIEPAAVGLKARTCEGLGPVGMGDAVAAQAVVLIGRLTRKCRRQGRSADAGDAAADDSDPRAGSS